MDYSYFFICTNTVSILKEMGVFYGFPFASFWAYLNAGEIRDHGKVLRSLLLKTDWPGLNLCRILSLKFLYLKFRLYFLDLDCIFLLWKTLISYSQYYIHGLCWRVLKRTKRIKIRFSKRCLHTYINCSIILQ